jgi:hypothetical protein
MQITAQEIRNKLNAVWPNLEYIWIWDATYWMVESSTVQAALDASNVPKMEFHDNFNDCDDFTLQFLAEGRRKRYNQYMAGNLPENERFSIAMGFAFGDMTRGIDRLHCVNLFVCRDGIWLVDSTPNEKRIWEAKPENDNLLFVFM